ncbi:MAG: 3'-5' exonuclease [Gammaproteobacteria bacterium TMED119]|nr:MAG: 3'-5' exonuclease [Gammaproteobacteria bacterium TMED119]OUV63462.1 MAG: 3'-5' exonuclease [Gammaproteobacteria bacterium TMED119]RCL46308.1 MAG: 3'-5' exonuclease [Candidatus Thioglobus sp.]|tara:strand:- start:453 stop:1229 length:777 start_codon:yes stop_codon:yes gene_type:complete
MSILVFDVESVPDFESGRKVHNLSADLSDKDVVKAMQHLQFQKSGSEFMPLHLQRIVAISVVFEKGDQLKVWSLGDIDATEKEIIQRFYEGLEQHIPTLVTWNGNGFDLPVLNYRALLHGVQAPTYWETGDDNQSFRFNNYISRFHSRHTDLMDVLGNYQPRGGAKLDEIATMLGYPGKYGMSGADVWDKYQQGALNEIRQYCETDVLNTYLVYLHFELIRGRSSPDLLTQKVIRLKNMLRESEQAHLQDFLRVWEDS